jgi:hypothetical protein
MSKKERTVTRSFRISESAFEALQEEARKRNVSVNTLHNLVLLTFADYDRFLNEFHMIKLSSSTFNRILKATNDEAIIEAGRNAGKNVPKGFMQAKDGRISEINCIEYLKLMSQYANLFQFNVSRSESGTSITLIHDFGEKGSLFFSEYVKSVFGLVDVRVQVSSSETSISFELSRGSGYY